MDDSQYQELKKQLDDVKKSVEQTNKYFRWTFWGTILTFVIPLIILLVALPFIIPALTGNLSGLGL